MSQPWINTGPIRHRFLRGALGLLLLASLLLGGCLSQAESLEQAMSEAVRDRVHAYHPDGPYAEVLADCMAIERPEDSCSLEELPTLGGPDGEAPDLDAIMDRVLVSHDWMGDRFREVLEEMPEDMRSMMRSVTAINIGSHIRPSYYSSWRAAIFIDPNYLWLTREERADIDLSPDYRSDFGRDLDFDFVYRHTRDNDYAWSFVPVGAENPEPRSIDDILLFNARLYYHELAHAVDYLEPQRLAELDRRRPVAFLTEPTVSRYLDAEYGLDSRRLAELARVRWDGEEATAAQRNYQPGEVGEWFGADGATHWYNYFTIREDVAMLTEAAMMVHHWDLEIDAAFTNTLADGETAGDRIVQWGQRNRLGDARVRERTVAALERLLPGQAATVAESLQALPEPLSLNRGSSWRANLDPVGLLPISRFSPEQMEAQDRIQRHGYRHRH